MWAHVHFGPSPPIHILMLLFFSFKALRSPVITMKPTYSIDKYILHCNGSILHPNYIESIKYYFTVLDQVEW